VDVEESGPVADVERVEDGVDDPTVIARRSVECSLAPSRLFRFLKLTASVARSPSSSFLSGERAIVARSAFLSAPTPVRVAGAA
jgi:hypothetical protein